MFLIVLVKSHNFPSSFASAKLSHPISTLPPRVELRRCCLSAPSESHFGCQTTANLRLTTHFGWGLGAGRDNESLCVTLARRIGWLKCPESSLEQDLQHFSVVKLISLRELSPGTSTADKLFSVILKEFYVTNKKI